MDITKIDKNFKQSSVTEFESNIYDLPNDKFALYGGYYDEKYGFIKMPHEISEKISEGVLWGSRCTAGVRVLFSTDSKTIKLTAKLFDKCLMNHMPFVGSAGFTLCEIENNKELLVGNFVPPLIEDDSIFTAQLGLKGKKMRNYILYFPLYSGVINITIELDKKSKVEKYIKYRDIKPILYYGSSITQGGCAGRADNCYQAYISEWTNTDYSILGFSGSAKAEDLMCDYLKNIPCSIFVCDYDHNANTIDDLERTHLKLYKVFRSSSANKNTPLILVSRPNAYYSKDTIERIKIIKNTYNYAIETGDRNIYFIEGRKCFPENLREHCTVDGCHPTDLGFYFMAKKIGKLIQDIL